MGGIDLNKKIIKMYLNNSNTVSGMQKHILAGYFLVLCLLCGFGSALTVNQNESQVIQSSDLIVYGKIVDVNSAWNAGKTHIETTAQVLVKDTLKNSDTITNITGTTLAISVQGGTVGNYSEWVEDTPVLIINTDAIFFLKKVRSDTYSVLKLYEVKDGKIGESASPAAINDIAAFKQKINAIQNNTGISTLTSTPIPTTQKAGLFYTSVIAITGYAIILHKRKK